MPLPPRTFLSIYELSARWGANPADIVGWAAEDHLTILTPMPKLRVAGKAHGGIVVVDPTDLLPAFRRDGTSQREVTIHAIRPRDSESREFITLDEPQTVAATDLLVKAADIQPLEEEWSLGPTVSRSAGGRPEKYDWEEAYQFLCVRLYARGIPESQTEMANEVSDFFVRRSKSGETPEIRTIVRRLQPLWKLLQEEQG